MNEDIQARIASIKRRMQRVLENGTSIDINQLVSQGNQTGALSDCLTTTDNRLAYRGDATVVDYDRKRRLEVEQITGAAGLYDIDSTSRIEPKRYANHTATIGAEDTEQWERRFIVGNYWFNPLVGGDFSGWGIEVPVNVAGEWSDEGRNGQLKRMVVNREGYFDWMQWIAGGEYYTRPQWGTPLLKENFQPLMIALRTLEWAAGYDFEKMEGPELSDLSGLDLRNGSPHTWQCVDGSHITERINDMRASLSVDPFVFAGISGDYPSVADYENLERGTGRLMYAMTSRQLQPVGQGWDESYLPLFVDTREATENLMKQEYDVVQRIDGWSLQGSLMSGGTSAVWQTYTANNGLTYDFPEVYLIIDGGQYERMDRSVLYLYLDRYMAWLYFDLYYCGWYS